MMTSRISNNVSLCFSDIRDLVSLEDVMEELKLGPNGGLICCMEYVELNFLMENFFPMLRKFSVLLQIS